MIRSLLTEYGLGWMVNRSLYSAKLKVMIAIPLTEKLFENKAAVKRIDIFNIDVNAIKDYLLSLPEKEKNEILLVADKAINGILKSFSSIELDYGNPINWHYNPLTKAESDKNVKWYYIPDFDSVRGDIKVIWEASRFTHFLYFSRAYLLTGEKKYYDVFSLQLEQWLKNNPYSYGANYKCGQECTLRMINALISYTVFKSCNIISKRDEENITRLVEGSYTKVLSNFFYAQKCIKNNHTFSEICGLIIGSWCCMDEKGVRKAYKLLDMEIQNQFLQDGGFSQYSFNYQRFTLQIIECVYKLSEKTGYRITESERIKDSALLMYQCQAENGDLPNYGSNDGALIFPVTVCGYRDFRPVLNTIYALIEGKRLYDPGYYDEELLWFGSGNKTALANIEREPSAFYHSGFYTLHHQGGFMMTCLQNFKSRPAHMDQLHIDLWHKGINVLCDSGTYSYASEQGKEITSTAGHNTVKFAGSEQMKKHGAFLVYDWTSCRNVIHSSESFSGTMISKNGYIHTRDICKTSQGYVVKDEVIGNGEYCEFYFHTPCEVRIIMGGFELIYNGSVICTVLVSDGYVDVKKAFRSLYYLKKEDIQCVVIKKSMKNIKANIKFDIFLSQ